MTKKIKKYHNDFSDTDPVRTKIHIRLFFLVLFWISGFALIMGRLVVVQVFEHDKYVEIGNRILPQEMPAQRGTIYDRNGEILAVDLVYYSLGIFPDQIENKTQVASKISNITHTSFSEILAKIKSKDTFAYLAHRLQPSQADELKSLKCKGMVLEKKYSRYYPYRENGAQVIGFCDFENSAEYGIEREYDSSLRGIAGHAVYQRDAKGDRFPDLNYPFFNPINGKNIVTTIDIVLQSVLEEELEKTINAHHAVNGSAVLLNVNTGEILALANYPGFDPNTYNKYPYKNFKNTAVSDQYEPGSTFKIIALALTLEQLKIDLNSNKIYCENGKYTIFKRTIYDHKKFGNLTIKEIFENSSNIGVIKLSRKFDPVEFYRYARDFGFGSLAGVDLPSESSGILHNPNEFTNSSTGYMSIGYGVAVTPLQIACAYAAIADKGRLLQPYVVNQIVDTDGHVILRNEPQVIRQVVSEETAKKMTATLQGVVENGTGKSAKIMGVSIAGKTGTAQKLDHDKNQYVSKYISSFVGFFPAESPRYALLIVVNEPEGEYYGSQVAAPAFRNIVQRIIGLPQNSNLASAQSNRLHFNQNIEKKKPAISPTSISGNYSQDYTIIKASQKISNEQNTQPKITTSVNKLKNDSRVPDFVGLTLREALEKLSLLDLKADFEGNGVVVEQFPRAGTMLSSETKIKLVCKAS